MAASPSVLTSVRAGLRALRRSPRALLMLLAAQVVVAVIFLPGRWLHSNAALFPKPVSLVLPFLFDVAVELVTVSALCFARETLVLGKPAHLSAFILPCTHGARHGVWRAVLTAACFILLQSGLTFLFAVAALAVEPLPQPLKLACVILYFYATDLLTAMIVAHARASFAFSPDIDGFHALLRDIKRWLPALLRFSLLGSLIGVALPLPAQTQSASAPQTVYSYIYPLLGFSLLHLLSCVTLPFLYGGRGSLAKD